MSEVETSQDTCGINSGSRVGGGGNEKEQVRG